MKKVILICLLFQICCTNSKTDRINDNARETIDGNKEESTKNSKYCFRDFDCGEHLESKGFDSIWVDNTEILRIGLKLICNQTYAYSDTVFFTKNSPCDSDSVIYRYVRNSLNIQHTFKGTTNLIEITSFSIKDFFEDKRLAIKGYIGNSFSILTNKNDSLVTVRVPVYFREIDIGEIATLEIDKLGNWTVKSIEKYEGFVPD
jgi:hypothetical protein